MTTMKTYLAALAILAVPVAGMAQDYDDLYYNPDKPAKTTVKATKKSTTTNRNSVPLSYYNYDYTTLPGADTYNVNTGSTLDVDAYNRHGNFLVTDTVAYDSITPDLFANTRRIERFHNADIISNTDNSDLATYYYSQQPQEINIYVTNPNPFPSGWYWRYGSPWYDWSWNYGWSVYDPWYYNTWGPTWSWSWSWGSPSWSWGWGWNNGWWPGYYPGYYPGYHPGHHPGWGHNWGYRPSGAGSSRPLPPAGGGTYRPGASGTLSSGYNRPGNMGRPGSGASSTNRGTSTGYRPANSTSGASSGSLSQPVNSRGRSSHVTPVNTGPSSNRQISTGSSSSSGRNGSYNSSGRVGSSSNNSSTRSSSFGSSRSSGSSFGGGSHSSGSSHSSGAGSVGRGRR